MLTTVERQPQLIGGLEAARTNLDLGNMGSRENECWHSEHEFLQVAADMVHDMHY